MIRDTSPSPEEHDFCLWTDGSGCMETGFTGSASLLIERETGRRETRVSANSYQSTYRAEFEAILNGLDSVFHVLGAHNASIKQQLMLSVVKPSVCWYGDNESLMLAAYQPSGEDMPVFRRKSHLDLWARYSYYAEALHITPMCIPRNSMPEHELVDRLSGESRMSLSDYIKTIEEDQII